jgi:PAS domain S-box-containing protein
VEDELDTTGRAARADALAWLAAIVDHSQDAILSKTLDGIITSWNGGAERLFGYTREEAVGQPITLFIPEDRRHEEEDIIARLRSGERIDRMETVRRKRSGEQVHIEVSISPVRDHSGAIIGASKIARDIGDRLRHAEEQALLVREMHHRSRISCRLSRRWSASGVGAPTMSVSLRTNSPAASPRLPTRSSWSSTKQEARGRRHWEACWKPCSLLMEWTG